MFKRLWNYFKGYVIIEISGFSIEKFLNLAINQNIKITNLTESKNGVCCNADIKNFKLLRKLNKKTGCKIKISIKKGFPFFILQNKDKKSFFFGSLIFVFIIYFASFFIWNIEISGNNILDNNKILEFCKNNNLYLGSYKKNINLKQLQSSLKNNFDEISWASISIKGTKATIKISENIPTQKNNIANTPSNIIANKSGIIEEIVTRSGTPLVEKYDIFEKGDILISGEVVLKEGEEIKGKYFTSADANIRAKTINNFTIEVPFKYKVKKYTKKVKREFFLIAFDKKIPLTLKPKITFEYYDKITSRKQFKLNNKINLPFILVQNKYKEYEKINKKYSLSEAKLQANKLITEKIISEVDFKSDIINKEITYTNLKEKLIANIKLTLIENVGTNDKIDLNILEENLKNEPNKITN